MNVELRAMTNSARDFDNKVIMSSAMPSAKYSCSGSPLILANGNTAIDGLTGSGRAGRGSGARLGCWDRAQAVDPQRPGNVLEALFSNICELDFDLVSH